MTGTGSSPSERVSLQSPGGVQVARVCCVVVALLMVAAIVYGGAMVLLNYDAISV